MKLVGKLKEDVAKATNVETAKKLIEEAGIQLTDEELEQVSGGLPIPLPDDKEVNEADIEKKKDEARAARKREFGV